MRLAVGPFRTLFEGIAAQGETVFLRSPLDCGTAAGEWFTLKPDAELAGDQRGDDAGLLVFETGPLPQPTELLGFRRLTLSLTPLAASGNLVARMVDVHPDGTATRVSYGVLNLAHRAGNETPEPVIAGAEIKALLRLDACS